MKTLLIIFLFFAPTLMAAKNSSSVKINGFENEIILERFQDTISIKNGCVCYLEHSKMKCIRLKKKFDPFIMSYNGIYVLDKNVIRKYSKSRFKDLTIYSVEDEFYQGQLYVINKQENFLVRDAEFNRDYLYSRTGIFIIDLEKNRILTLDKPYYDNKKGVIYTPIEMYAVKEHEFKFLRIYNEKGELAESAQLLKKFLIRFKKS